MYSFEEFKNEIITRIKEKLAEEYGQAEITEEKVAKNNCVLTGVRFDLFGGEKMRIQPIIYVEHLYADYENDEDMEDICERVLSIHQQAINDTEEVGNRITNILDEKENIVFALVHTEGNEQWLRNVPHREYLDMSIMYRWFVSNNGMVNSSAIVTNQLARRLELSESDLYDLAYENTKRIFEPRWFDVSEFLEMNCDMSEIEVAQKQRLYGISNEAGMYGAASILYEDVMEDLANKIGSNLYLLPSSIHEFLAISSDCEMNLEQLQEMVYEINFTQVEIDERLSNQIYHYDRSTKQVTQITNTPYTRLDVREKDLESQNMDNEEFDDGESMGIQLTM